MKVEHLAMYVNDLEKAKYFFVTYFNGLPNEGYYNKGTGFRSYFLTFESGSRLELMNKHVMEVETKTLTRTGLIHIALSVGSKDAVDALTFRLKEGGYPVISCPKTMGDRY
jgi:lactoylglutathione lyase